MLRLNQEYLRVDVDFLQTVIVLEHKLLVREWRLSSDHGIQEHVQEHRWTLECSGHVEQTTCLILEEVMDTEGYLESVMLLSFRSHKLLVL